MNVGQSSYPMGDIHMTRLLNGGVKVVGSQQAAISNSAGGDEQAKINAILAALRAHGLIASS